MKAKAAHAHDQQAAAPYAIFMSFFSDFSRVNRSGTGKPLFSCSAKNSRRSQFSSIQKLLQFGQPVPNQPEPRPHSLFISPKMEKHQPRFQPSPPSPPSSSCSADESHQVNNYQCGFTTHVQSATLLIGAVGSLAGSAVLAALLKSAAQPDVCVLAGLFLCSYALLVLGWSTRMPCFYWPFLLLNPLLICLCAVFCTYPALDFILAPIVFPEDHPAKLDFGRMSRKQQLLVQVTHSLRLMELVSSLAAILVLAYFQSIVYRAHNWQRKQNKLDEQLIIIGDQTP